MAKISGYNYHCNDVSGKFGTNQTATGIPISEKDYTIAVPMNTSRTPYRTGDVVMVKNDKNDNAALYLVTDVGGMPHADIDIVGGVGLQALGVDVTKTTSSGGVAAVSQTEGFSTQKVGSYDIKYGKTDAVAPLQALLHDINKGEKPVSALEDIAGYKPVLKGEQSQKMVKSLAPDVKPDELNKKGHEYKTYDPSATRRKENELAAYQQSLLDEGNTLMAFMIAIAMIVMGKDAEPLFGNVFGQNTGPGVEGGGIAPTGGYKYDNKGTIGGKSSGYSFELAEYNGGKAGEYFGDAAKEFVGQKEVGGNNRGEFVDWVMDKAGLAGTGNPWCAGFCSKIYEGTGMFNYTASALAFARQGASTGSYVNGMSGIDNIEKGDPIVFDRKAVGDAYGHVGIVTDVNRNSEGKVVSITTVEGNTGKNTDRVLEKTYSLDGLKGARYLGHVDVSHRAEKLGIDLEKQLDKNDQKPKLSPEVEDKIAVLDSEALSKVVASYNSTNNSAEKTLVPSSVPDMRSATEHSV